MYFNLGGLIILPVLGGLLLLAHAGWLVDVARRLDWSRSPLGAILAFALALVTPILGFYVLEAVRRDRARPRAASGERTWRAGMFAAGLCTMIAAAARTEMRYIPSDRSWAGFAEFLLSWSFLYVLVAAACHVIASVIGVSRARSPLFSRAQFVAIPIVIWLAFQP